MASEWSVRIVKIDKYDQQSRENGVKTPKRAKCVTGAVSRDKNKL